MSKVRYGLASLCVVAFLVVSLGTAATSPVDPLPYEPTNHLGQVARLQHNEALYRDTPRWDEFTQQLGTARSYIGNYKEALAYFDTLLEPEPAGEGREQAFTNCVPRDAVSVIVR